MHSAKLTNRHLPGGPAPKRNSSEPTPVFHHLLHMLYTFSEGKWPHVKWYFVIQSHSLKFHSSPLQKSCLETYFPFWDANCSIAMWNLRGVYLEISRFVPSFNSSKSQMCSGTRRLSLERSKVENNIRRLTLYVSFVETWGISICHMSHKRYPLGTVYPRSDILQESLQDKNEHNMFIVWLLHLLVPDISELEPKICSMCQS